MDERTALCPTDGLSVIVVDEDQHHASLTRSILCQHNYHATTYTSPIKALEFLEAHAQEVDVALVAVHMEEMHGFHFLDMVREAHKKIQVIMMSKETTLDTMKRCVELGACFLVSKPIDARTINNLWQHLDIEKIRMDNIKQLLQGNGEKAHDANYQIESTKTKKRYICWNEYLHGKFLHALKILGEDASPRSIEIIMNVEGVNRKHISSHLQKYRRHMEGGKQNSALGARKGKNGTSASKSAKKHQKGPKISLDSPDIQQKEIIADEGMSHAQAGSFSDNNVHAAMLRSIQFGTIYDESQYFYLSSGDEATEYRADMMGDGAAQDDATNASGFSAQDSAAEIFSADGTKDILNNCSSKEQDRNDEEGGKAIKLVEYSDSEDDEI